MYTRRLFLKLSSAAAFFSLIPLTVFGTMPKQDKRQRLLSLADELLIKWCDGFLAYQIHKPCNPSLHGALWSPGDKSILGRCAEAVYPLLWCAKRNQNQKYMDAAEKVVQWSIHNLAQPDGSWYNGPKDKWDGITVCIASALGQAIFYHGDILTTALHDTWMDRLNRSGNWLYNTIDIEYSNINYPAANAYAMALLGILLGNTKFSNRGKELAHQLMNYFSENNLLFFGEGRKNKEMINEKSPKGCYPVDLGYNVEESLPSLAMYGLLRKDNTVLDKVVESLRAHLEFMLPDGGWDNSWGTRNHKWTWWGSRTSDGCQPAYALLSDRDPAFLEAAYRNTTLLKSCTYDGILFGGPDYFHRGVKPSLHHAVCHAKALTTILDGYIPEPPLQNEILPCEHEYKIRKFRDISTCLISSGNWRATFTTYDFPYYWKAGHATGGALSLLWHRDVGPLLSASMSIYRLIEPFDMQKEDGEGFETLTPRIEFVPAKSLFSTSLDWLLSSEKYNGAYTNILDFNADIDTKIDSDSVIVTAKARLLNEKLETSESGDIFSKIIYRFFPDALTIELNVNPLPGDGSLIYTLPVLSRSSEPTEKESAYSLRIQKGNYCVILTSDNGLILPDDFGFRVFNYVPGFEAFPVRMILNNKLKLSLRVVKKV